MAAEIDQGEAIERLAQHEEIIEQFYRNCARKFPEAQPLFLHIADEEAGHADILRNLKEKLIAGEVSLSDNRFKSRTVLSAIESIYELITKTINGKIDTLKQAMISALEVEQALLEKEIFQAFKHDSPELAAILQKVAHETQQHQNSLAEAIKKLDG